jgi:glycosyltransferase involved in cell wall biosynthesis
MPQRRRVLLLTHAWHAQQSAAFEDLVTSALSPDCDLDRKVWPLEDPVAADVESIICCQVLPTLEWLQRQKARIVWVPMWDDVSGHPTEWWHTLPKNLSVVSFSEAVTLRAQQAGLQVLTLRYFKDPDEFEPVDWRGPRTLLYWNRRGLVGPSFLLRFCEAMKIERILFRSDLDPGASQSAAYQPSERIGRIVVEHLPRCASREDYYAKVKSAQIVIAPRLEEGVGMIMLEALVRGCAVFAANRPTMNEYIHHGVDGYLFRPRSFRMRVSRAIRSRLAAVGIGAPPLMVGLGENQDWKTLASLDLAALGASARAAHVAGHRRWLDVRPRYLEFVFGDRN